MASLYERLRGLEAIKAVVHFFEARRRVVQQTFVSDP
jgi:hypothetical protein